MHLPSIHGSSHTSSSSIRVDHASSFRSEGYDSKAFNMQMREQLDGEIARMFFSAGLFFNLARNPYYKNAFTFACNNNFAGYVPLGYNAIDQNYWRGKEQILRHFLNGRKECGKKKVYMTEVRRLALPQSQIEPIYQGFKELEEKLLTPSSFQPY
ncbi:hypothetical protein M5K25_023245 [Dendrobium thyrsiflorum]|uniref:Uncharacterized protein n=1 Tax=Dendrobium thyrsiflorum TaxID=117978 RepID=A0ABD0UED2_DENTH